MSVEITSAELKTMLDEAGLSSANVKRRHLYWDMWSYLTSEVKNLVWYISGSVREGVVDLDNMDSDLDVMIIRFDCVAVDRRQSMPPSNDMVDYVIAKKSRTPGFKILVYTEAHHSSFALDNNSLTAGLFNSNGVTGKGMGYGNKTLEMCRAAFTSKGPAGNISFCDSTAAFNIDMDWVPAVKCLHFPEEAEEWWYRPRNFDWPSRVLIDEIVNKGCHLVGIGSAPEKKKEWRISFSMAEQILLRSFNGTQLKCYALLKHFLKSTIKNKVPNTLCSYHMKTLMFWLCEETPALFWQEENLKECFIFCMSRLRELIAVRCCRHYFMRSVNIFAKNLTQCTAKQLTDIIDSVLQTNCRDVFQNFRKAQGCALRYGFYLMQCLNAVSRSSLNSIQSLIEDLGSSTAPKHVACLLNKYHRHMAQEICIDTFVIAMCPTLFELTARSIQFAMLMECKLRNKDMYKEKRQLLYELKVLSYYDLSSGKLKLATIYLKLNKFKDCIGICSQIIRQHQDLHVRLSHRYDFSSIRDCVYKSLQINWSTLPNQLMSKFVNFDVVFSPLEISLVPDAVKEEMRRDKYYLSHSNKRLPWHSWGFYDPIVFAHYTLVLCHHELRQHEDRDRVFLQLQNLLYGRHSDHVLVYPEAARFLTHHCMRLCRSY